MKKKILTEQDIQNDLLFQINKAKKLSVFLSVILAITVFFYISFVTNYADIMSQYMNGNLRGKCFHPVWGLLIGPAVIILFLVFLLNYYYIDLYQAKKGKFTIVKEAVSNKQKEQTTYYKHTEKENLLYFPCGKISVEKEVYSYTQTGDFFFIVILRNKKAPSLVYPTKYYDIAQF